VVLFVAGTYVGFQGAVRTLHRQFTAACPTVFSPREGEVETLAPGPGIFPPRATARPVRQSQLGALAHVRGSVVVLARIEADGSVSRAELAQSSGFCPYDDQALKDVRQWTFQPARRLGEAVAAWIPITVRYEPADAPRPSRPAPLPGEKI
jgi:TonB family protein